MQNSVLPYDIQWSTGSTTNPTDLWTNGNEQDTITYTVDITDGCGFLYEDTVIMVVNQTLSIDSLWQLPASACAPDGAASAFVSGLTTNNGQPFYNWTGPGNPGPNSVDATVITNVPSGWYYFSVTDDVCTEEDSIFIDMNNPPMAATTPSITLGCGPLDVTFTNESVNTTNYTWDFGGGNVVTTTSTNPQTETFLQTTNVMLIAADDQNCADTTYVTIQVDPCGCTDPEATNYNPFATIDDGSCTYPTPTVVTPNIFTPNDDGDNDLFVLTTTNSVNIELTILNRWGNVMYESSGPNPAWDGQTQGGVNAEEGTYFFKYAVYGIEGDPLEGHGFLQLVRD
jgi:gliding motility-associated-like protein